eukprot:4277457-Pyramimonas_sp.AAC.1
MRLDSRSRFSKSFANCRLRRSRAKGGSPWALALRLEGAKAAASGAADPSSLARITVRVG